MQRSDAGVGSCPECTAAIRSRDVLVTYETDGSTDYFAECPECHAVVHPTDG